jgi:hypothetical protein
MRDSARQNASKMAFYALKRVFAFRLSATGDVRQFRGGDKGFATRDFVAECRHMNATPHVAPNHRRSAAAPSTRVPRLMRATASAGRSENALAGALASSLPSSGSNIGTSRSVSAAENVSRTGRYCSLRLDCKNPPEGLWDSLQNRRSRGEGLRL